MLIYFRIKLLLILRIFGLFILFSRCSAEENGKSYRISHQAEVRNFDGTRVYADKIDNKHIFQSIEPSSRQTKFISFKVGFIDSSLLLDKMGRQKKGEYLQYQLENKWKALVNRDSVSPIFLQPMLKRAAEEDGVLLVFEVPMEQDIDTLTYNDMYNGNGLKQLIVVAK